MNGTLSLFTHPTRGFMHMMRKHQPIWILGRRFPGITMVFRHDDVVEVLARNDDFTMAFHDLKMRSCIGPFVLGMDDTAQYRREAPILRQALALGATDKAIEFVTATADELIETATRHKPTLDVVQEFCNPLASRFASFYYGIPDPGHGVLLKWFKMMSHYIFALDLMPRVAIPAVRASAFISDHIAGVLARARDAANGGPPSGNNVLERLLALQANPETRLGDSDIVRTLAGTISGTMIPTFWLFTNAMNRLLDLPAEHLDGAIQAARHGDDAVVRAYLQEAARFCPVPSVIFRYCERECTLGAGTRYETRVPEGSLMALSVTSANADPDAIEEPEQFKVDRDEDAYLLYGSGQHLCVGKNLADAMMTQMAKVLLGRGHFRRAPGPEGRLSFGPKNSFPDANYPHRLLVDVAGTDGMMPRRVAPFSRQAPLSSSRDAVLAQGCPNGVH